MSSIVSRDFSKLCRPYQDEGVSFLYEHDAALLLLRMGAGKSVITLTAINELIVADYISTVLIVAPLAVCENTWSTEHRRWTHTDGLSVGIATGGSGARTRVLGADYQVTVINYENLQWMAKLWPGRTWDLIVLDEVTRFNRPDGKRYRALLPFLKRAQMRWGLTGSLSANNLEHVYNPVRAIDLGAALGSTITPFRREFFIKATFGYDMIPGSPEKVAARIKHLCYQPDPAVYASQLPPIVYSKHTYELGSDAAARYFDLRYAFVTEHEGAVVDVASAGVLVNKLQQVASGFLYDEEGEALRIDEDRFSLLAELIAEAAGENVVIWYWFAATGDALRNLGFVDLVSNLDAWNRGEIPVAICHPRSGGHGINAQAGGSRMIWLEHTWSAEERAQAVARLHRQGQASTVYVHDIVGEINGRPAIDVAILESQQSKRTVADVVMRTLL